MDSKPPALAVDLDVQAPLSQRVSILATSEPLRITFEEHKAIEGKLEEPRFTPHERSRLNLSMVVIIATFSMISNVCPSLPRRTTLPSGVNRRGR
jgi:hypothetical protein